MDISTKYNDYQSLGQEFLTYLYFKANTENTNYKLGKKVVFTKFDDKKPIEKTTISGDDTDTQAGRLLLSENAIITEMQIILNDDSDDYIVTLKASDLNFNGFKTPKVEVYNNLDEYEGSIIEKMSLIEIAFNKLDEMYKEFIDMKFSEKYDEYKLQLQIFANIKENE